MHVSRSGFGQWKLYPSRNGNAWTQSVCEGVAPGTLTMQDRVSGTMAYSTLHLIAQPLPPGLSASVHPTVS